MIRNFKCGDTLLNQENLLEIDKTSDEKFICIDGFWYECLEDVANHSIEKTFQDF